MYMYTKMKYEKIALISNCFTLIMEQFFRFDRVDIREESSLKKFACLGMPFQLLLLLLFFCFFFLTAEYRIILPCIKLSKIFRFKAHFTIYGKLDTGLENVRWIVFFPY